MTPTEIPCDVMICGVLHTLRTSKNTAADDDTTTIGTYNFSTAEISVGADLHEDSRRSVVLHEVMHGLDAASGTELGEQGVSSLASTLFAVMRGNPDLVKWLMGW